MRWKCGLDQNYTMVSGEQAATPCNWNAKKLSPTEYKMPDPVSDRIDESIVSSHSLIPDAL